MKVYHSGLSPAQVAAGFAVMKGEFTSLKVMNALLAAGVKNCHSEADALIRRELRLGNVRRITRGIYEKS